MCAVVLIKNEINYVFFLNNVFIIRLRRVESYIYVMYIVNSKDKNIISVGERAQIFHLVG